MKNVGSMSLEELESLIEQKILEIFGDPDSGLNLKDDFAQKLKARLSDAGRRIPHHEVVEKFG